MRSATAEDLKSVMRRVASSVAVVTAHGQDGDAGITATSVASVTMEPPSILVCINKTTRLHAAVLGSGEFRVNYLSEHQQDVAAVFGGQHTGDRFERGAWHRKAPCGPRLCESLGSMPCTLARATDCGTHTVFIGTVGTAELQAGNPLLYCNGEYSRLIAADARGP